MFLDLFKKNVTMRVFYILPLLVAVVFANATPQAAEDTALVRCKRPLCDFVCDNGFKVGANGCPICECNEPEPANLQPTEMPCPVVDCMMLCPFGRAKNEMGCDTCQCKSGPCDGYTCENGLHCVIGIITDCEPGKECELEPMCIEGEPETIPHSCRLMKCSSVCTMGNKKDNMGCPTCECMTDPCQDKECPLGEECRAVEVKCVKAPCPMLPQCTYKPWCEHMNGMMEGNPFMLQGAPMMGGRPMPEQHNSDRDDDHHMGLAGQAARRVSRAVRQARQAMKDPMGLGRQTKLECAADGGFKPLQCNRELHYCFCVDDRGMRVPESGKVIDKEEDIPACVQNRTKSVQGTFEVSHDLDDVGNHLENIHNVMKDSLSEWMQISHAYIVTIGVEICKRDDSLLIINFMVVSDDMGNIDLATSINHLRMKMDGRQLSSDYMGHQLVPRPGSAQFVHQFQPAMPMLPDRPLTQPADEFIMDHRVIMISACVGLLILLGVVLCTCAAISKRRRANFFKHQKMNTFKENLAFNNELYGQMKIPVEVKEGLEEPELVVPSGEDEKNEAIA